MREGERCCAVAPGGLPRGVLLGWFDVRAGGGWRRGEEGVDRYGEVERLSLLCLSAGVSARRRRRRSGLSGAASCWIRREDECAAALPCEAVVCVCVRGVCVCVCTGVRMDFWGRLVEEVFGIVEMRDGGGCLRNRGVLREYWFGRLHRFFFMGLREFSYGQPIYRSRD